MLMRKNVNNCQQNSLVRVDGRRRYEWTRTFLKKEKKSCFLKRILIRVDRALKSSLLVKLKNACITPYCNAITKLTDQSESQLKLISTEGS